MVVLFHCALFQNTPAVFLVVVVVTARGPTSSHRIHNAAASPGLFFFMVMECVFCVATSGSRLQCHRVKVETRVLHGVTKLGNLL